MNAGESGFSSGRHFPLAPEQSKGRSQLQATGSGISCLLSSPHSSCLRSGSRTVSFLLVRLPQKLGPHSLMTSFLGCNLLGAVVVYFFLYESSGLSLESVDMVWYFRLHTYSIHLIDVNRCIKIRRVSHGTPVNGHQRVTRTVKSLRQRRRRRKTMTVCPLRQIRVRREPLTKSSQAHLNTEMKIPGCNSVQYKIQ